MLKYLRNKKTARKIWIGLAVIIVPPFVLWGSGSLLGNRDKNTPEYAGRLFGRKIPMQEFKDSFDAVKNQLLLQYGEDFPKVASSMDLEGAAWERILILGEAKRRHIRVSDQELIDALSRMPSFQYKGAFNERAYNEILTYVLRVQPRLFEEQMRQTLVINKLFSQVAGQVTVSDQEVQDEYRKQNEQVSIWYIESLSAEFEKQLTPSDEELKAYFDKNALNFKVPLSFNLEYVEIPLQGKDGSGVKNAVNALYGLIRKKEPLEKAAAQLGLAVKETGLFAETDPIPGIGWSAQLSTVIFKSKPGDYLPMLSSEKSQFILRLKERKDPYVPEFSAIKDKVKEAYIKERSRGMAKEKIESCWKAAKEEYQKNPKAVDLEKIARTCGLKAGSAGPFNFGSYIEGIGASDNFWIMAESVKDDEVSPPLPTQTGFYLVKLKSKVPYDQKKFEEEKAAFSQTVLAAKKGEIFAKFINQLKEKSQQ